MNYQPKPVKVVPGGTWPGTTILILVLVVYPTGTSTGITSILTSYFHNCRQQKYSIHHTMSEPDTKKRKVETSQDAPGFTFDGATEPTLGESATAAAAAAPAAFVMGMQAPSSSKDFMVSIGFGLALPSSSVVVAATPVLSFDAGAALCGNGDDAKRAAGKTAGAAAVVVVVAAGELAVMGGIFGGLTGLCWYATGGISSSSRGPAEQIPAPIWIWTWTLTVSSLLTLVQHDTTTVVTVTVFL